MKKKRKPGSGMVRRRTDGRWEGRIVTHYDEHGLPKTKSVTAKTKAECLAKMEAIKEDQKKTEPQKPEVGMTFGRWMDYWYQTYSKPGIKPKTQSNYEYVIYKRVIPEIGDVKLDDLSTAYLNKFYSQLKESGRRWRVETDGEGLSERTIRNCHACIRMALNKAVEERLIGTNPALECKLPSITAEDMKLLTHEEMKHLLIQAKEEDFFEIVLLDLTTGMRKGELLALKWDDLDFKTGELKIRRQVSAVKGELIISEPKTKATVRTVILPRSVVEVLRRHKATTNSMWIFPSPLDNNKTWDPDACRKKLTRILNHAGCQHIRFHDIRHSFATLSLENGMDIKTLSNVIGHRSVSTTLNIYSHTTDIMRRDAAQNIDRGIVGNERSASDELKEHAKPTDKFQPYKGNRRKPGTGCVTELNDHLFEGRYGPRGADGKRFVKTVYATTREECEEKLREMIVETKREIAEERVRLAECHYGDTDHNRVTISDAEPMGMQMV